MSELQNTTEIPKTWKLVKLGEICDIISGKNQKKVLDPQGKYPIYGSSGIFGYANEFLCREGTTIIGRKGTINSPIFVNTKFWNVDTAFGLSPKESYNNKLLYYFCLSFNFHKLDKSTTIPSLAKSDLLEINIPLPPIHSQQAIVSKIEELFSELDKGIEQLKTAQHQLKTYRQAVLKWAFEGKLTNEQVTEEKLPKGWNWIKLGTLMESVRNGYSGKPTENGQFKILRISSVRPNKIYLDDTRYLEREIGMENSIKENDLLFTRYNGSIDFVGVCGRVPKLNQPIFYPDKLIRCRPIIKDWFHAAYIDYASNSWMARKFVLSKIKTTAGQTGISGSDIKEIPIPLPLLGEQLRIVQEIENRLSVADKLEENINQALQQAEALRQSILKKAFEGKLVATDTIETINSPIKENAGEGLGTRKTQKKH